jgi:hypothetical protein
MRMHKASRYLSIVIFALAAAVAIAAEAPVTGALFDSLLAYQNIELQHALEELYPESDGYLVTGPLDPLLEADDDQWPLFSSVRVVCPDLAYCDEAVEAFSSSGMFDVSTASVNRAESDIEFADCGVTLFQIDLNSAITYVQFTTTQQVRFQIWSRRVMLDRFDPIDQEAFAEYSAAVSHYLCRIDSGSVDVEPPVASEYGLLEGFDLYASARDYVIQGYDNYKEFMRSHSELETDFARGILAFVPTDKTLQRFKENAPREAHPNKEAAKLQEEYRRFFERGGDVRIMETLTVEGFDTLRAGEYFFAVSLSGKIRFGRELLREEVKRLERETGRKVPRANHAFLFPGEPVLTAGAFFIDERKAVKLVGVNAQSGHYFYSNITETIKEDIAERSDHYLLTLGHFFRALDSIGVSYEGILISKF